MAGSTGQATQGWLPWVAVKGVTNFRDRANDSACLGMGYYLVGTTSGSEWNVDTWLDSVTFKVSYIYLTASDIGIATFKLDSTTLGTVDGYSAGVVRNNYNEITGITIATAGIKNFQVICTTKNASSAGFNIASQSVALIRTSQVGASTPGGTDTPGYTWELPGAWMGSKAHTNFETARDQVSSSLSGGWLRSSSAQNAEVSWDIWLDTGTCKFALVYAKEPDVGIFSVQLDTVEQGTIDGYNAAQVLNTYAEVTGITVATAGVKTFKLKMATKNASSSAYTGRISSVKWVRTGA